MTNDYFARRLVAELRLAAAARNDAKRSVHLRACYLLCCLLGLQLERPVRAMRRARYLAWARDSAPSPD